MNYLIISLFWSSVAKFDEPSVIIYHYMSKDRTNAPGYYFAYEVYYLLINIYKWVFFELFKNLITKEIIPELITHKIP